ncbi:MAG: hypothetical protein mread185_000378 [Mycoplasmataceae bacterium]|nr:MAG: hypothetical protein mread185_000378 [Mycoplasmataceae bacterium]
MEKVANYNEDSKQVKPEGNCPEMGLLEFLDSLCEGSRNAQARTQYLIEEHRATNHAWTKQTSWDV